jgi:small-conductance mechanosensitive channel
MYAQVDTTARSLGSSTARPTRATLRTRPRIQRSLIRSWEYIQPVRISILVVRLMVVLWQIFLAVELTSAGYTWGWSLLAAAAAMLAVSVWVFATATKGWPLADD